MSRVVHARIGDRHLALCFRLLARAGKPTDNLAAATAVRDALGAMLEGLVAQGYLEDITTEEAIKFLDDRIGQALIIEGMPVPIFEGDSGPAQVPDLKDRINETLGKVQSGGLEPGAPDNLPEAEEDEIDVIPLDDLLLAAPKDAILENIDRSNADLVNAVEQVYSVIPRDMWGTDKALNLIQRVLDEKES
mgnify:CR=1 FL=1